MIMNKASLLLVNSATEKSAEEPDLEEEGVPFSYTETSEPLVKKNK